MIVGVGPGSVLLLASNEFLLELIDGGGDFIRGEADQCGVFSPDPTPERCALGNRDKASVTEPGCS